MRKQVTIGLGAFTIDHGHPYVEARPDGISRCMQPISQDAPIEAADPSTAVASPVKKQTDVR